MAATPLRCTMQASSNRRKANHAIYVSDDKSRMEISFQRTIRVADGLDTSELPPSMGTSIFRTLIYTISAVLTRDIHLEICLTLRSLRRAITDFASVNRNLPSLCCS